MVLLCSYMYIGGNEYLNKPVPEQYMVCTLVDRKHLSITIIIVYIEICIDLPRK